MKNVYDEVRRFYEEDTPWDPIIKRDWIEGFFRQEAWQGATDDDLRDLWVNIRAFALYLEATDNDYSGCLEEMPAQEYGLAIQWMTDNVEGYKKSLKAVRHFFDVLLNFYKYLTAKKLVQDYDELEMAAKEISGGKKLQLFPAAFHEGVPSLFGDGADSATHSGDMLHSVGEAVERLMTKLGSYFQQTEFAEDFHRALFLYTGPVTAIPGEEQDEFWLGFWDYFLFDYHLLASDVTPLAHFRDDYGAKLTHDERHILHELLSAKFVVFYISQVVNQEWVECVNLFTDEKFRLPHPHFNYNQLKKLLFFGHVFAKENVMVNYVTSLEVSTNLRRRIKEEVERQKALFVIQKPGATWDDMFNRHALVVRHAIDMLATLAKVNVIPFDQLGRFYPIIEDKREPNSNVMEEIGTLMRVYGFSLHDIHLARKLWYDYSQLVTVTVRKPEIWAATVVCTFSQLNSYNAIPAESLASDLEISASSIYNYRTRLYDTLELRQFDPRYINEEGFVMSLFSS